MPAIKWIRGFSSVKKVGCGIYIPNTPKWVEDIIEDGPEDDVVVIDLSNPFQTLRCGYVIINTIGIDIPPTLLAGITLYEQDEDQIVDIGKYITQGSIIIRKFSISEEEDPDDVVDESMLLLQTGVEGEAGYAKGMTIEAIVDETADPVTTDLKLVVSTRGDIDEDEPVKLKLRAG